MVEPGPDREERHIQAISSSLKRALETGEPDEGVDEAVRAAMGDEVAQDELEQPADGDAPPATGETPQAASDHQAPEG